MYAKGAAGGGGSSKSNKINNIATKVKESFKNAVKTTLNKNNTQSHNKKTKDVMISTANHTETFNLTETPKIKSIKEDLNNITQKTIQNKNTTKRIVDKVMPVGLGINVANAEAHTIIPYNYAKKYGQEITSLTQVLPEKITASKAVNNFTSTKAGNWIAKQANNTYIGSIRGANQFYNGGKFIVEDGTFGAQALSETAATVGNASSVLKAATSLPNIAGAGLGGIIETYFNTKEKYFDKGGFEEVTKHGGEIGGRLIGATAGNLIGTAAATTVSAMAAGAATGAAAGTVVPVVGNVVGAVVGCVVGAAASTIIGDATAELGANLFDGVTI